MAAKTGTALPDSRTVNRKKTLVKIKKSWQLYLMLLLPVIYIILFKYVPMVGIILAFKKYTAAGGIFGSEWVGLYQFKKLFGSYQFLRIFKNTLAVATYSLAAGFPFPIILALLLNATVNKKFKKTVQMVTYLPHFISVVVMVGILSQMFNVRTGLYGSVAGVLGIEPVDILGMPQAFRHLYVWSGVWQNMGWGTILYLAVLSSVDVGLHEAAVIDGASRFKRLIHIDMPALAPTVVIVLIMRCGQIMGVGFEKVFLLQNSLNQSTSEVISTYSYKVGLLNGGGDFSYSTAIGLFNSVVNFVLLITVNFISRKVSDTSLF